jgi:hypothetical protein
MIRNIVLAFAIVCGLAGASIALAGSASACSDSSASNTPGHTT